MSLNMLNMTPASTRNFYEAERVFLTPPVHYSQCECCGESYADEDLCKCQYEDDDETLITEWLCPHCANELEKELLEQEKEIYL